MKAEQQHRYHRAALHTSIQQSGASSGLDRTTCSATTTTDNPQDRSPCSKHWLDAVPIQSFQAVGMRNAVPKRAKKTYNVLVKKRRRLVLKTVGSQREKMLRFWLFQHEPARCCQRSLIALSLSLSLCSCSLALQQHSSELCSDVIAQPHRALGRGRGAWGAVFDFKRTKVNIPNLRVISEKLLVFKIRIEKPGGSPHFVICCPTTRQLASPTSLYNIYSKQT